MRLLSFLVAAAAFLAGCGSKAVITGDLINQDSCAVRAVLIVPESISIHVGDTSRPTVQVQSCAASSARGVRWSSADTSVASIDSVIGLLTARRTGHTSAVAAAVADPSIKGAMAVAVTP